MDFQPNLRLQTTSAHTERTQECRMIRAEESSVQEGKLCAGESFVRG